MTRALLVRRARITHAQSSGHLRLLVFCPEKRRSLSRGECMECPKFRSLQLANGGERLHCVPEVEDSAVWTGEGLASDVEAVLPDVPLERARDLVQKTRFGVLPVVAEDATLLGVIWRADIEDRRPHDGVLSARDRMRSVHTVAESTSILSALRAMARVHGREVVIVDSDGRLVGVLPDVEALRALRSTEPQE